MSIEERIQTIRLLERINRNPEYAKQIGVSVNTRTVTEQKKKSGK